MVRQKIKLNLKILKHFEYYNFIILVYLYFHYHIQLNHPFNHYFQAKNAIILFIPAELLHLFHNIQVR